MPVAERQFNINLPESIADELQDIAERSHLTMPEVIQRALALVKIASDVSKNKQKLVVTDESGQPIKEIVIRK
jgi:hypothetical protein